MMDLYPLFEPKTNQTYTVEKDGVGLISRNLYDWTKKQKADHAANKLNQEQIDYLEFLELDWNHSSSSVNQWENCLKVYRKQRLINRRFEPVVGEVYDAEVTGNILTVKNLAQWCHENRVFFQKGKISKERLQKLKSVNFAFENENANTRDYAWAHNFKVYSSLMAKNPSFKPKKRKVYTVTVKGEKLSSDITHWIDYQRMEKRRNALSKEKIETLDGIKFAWSVDPKHKRYSYPEMVALLLECYAKKGLPSPNEKYQGKPLGQWMKRTVGFLNIPKERQFLSQQARDQLNPVMNLLKLYEKSYLGGKHEWERNLEVYSEHFKKEPKFKPEIGKTYKAKVGVVTQSVKLYKWANNQKSRYSKRILEKDQVQKLKNLKVI